MKQATLNKEDHLTLYILIAFGFVFLIYLATIAWVVYEFLHSPTEPSTRIFYPIIGERVLSRTRQVRYFRTKIFPR